MRIIKRRGYTKNLPHRLGFLPNLPKSPSTKRIWIQAVSVGEVNALESFIQELTQRKNIQIMLTTTTCTAYAILQKRYKNNLKVIIGLFPLDFWPLSALAWNRIQPNLAILMESELWPEHIHQANKRRVPIFLINARLSDRSFQRYQTLYFWANPIIKKLDSVLASSEQDFKRFLELGIDPQKLILSGNIKLDLASHQKPFFNAQKNSFRQELGIQDNTRVLLGSSTWPGEEALLVETFRTFSAKHPESLLILVPRHAERRSEIQNLLQRQPLPYHFRSQHKNAPSGTRIYVADTTGELSCITPLAHVAFIGKSLPPNQGGQSPIEAAASAVPIVFGLNMSNFYEIAASLESAQAGIRTHNAQEAQKAILRLLESPDDCTKMSLCAKAWHQQNQGATKRVIQHLEPYLDPCLSPKISSSF